MPRRIPSPRKSRRAEAPCVRRLKGGLYSLPVYECQLALVNRLHSPRAHVVSSLSAALVARAAIGAGDRERFVVVCLRADGRVLGVDVAAVGTLGSVEIDVANVFRAPLLLGAESVVIAHNHIAEYVTPSKADRRMTARVYAAGEILGVDLADSLIIGPHGAYYSFRDEDQMPDQLSARRKRDRAKR